MKKNQRSFKFNNQMIEIIEQLFSKITRGQLRIDQVEWTGGSPSDTAKLTVKIDGAAPVFDPRSYDANGNGTQEPASGTEAEENLTPDEKRVQEQVANCYL